MGVPFKSIRVGADLMAEDTPSTPERIVEEAAMRRERPPARVLIAIAVVVAILAAAAWALSRPDSTASSSLDDAHRVAAEFGAAYLTFDASSVDLAGDELLALTTDRFAAEFRSDRLPAVSNLFADSSTSTRAEASETFVSPVINGRVRALVFVDVLAVATEGSQRLINLSFVIELVDDDGWRVDGVSPVPAPEVLDPAIPTSTTVASPSTSLPPSPG